MVVLSRSRGRPPTGCPKWNPDKQVWEARVLLPSGGRPPVPMPGIPARSTGSPRRRRATAGEGSGRTRPTSRESEADLRGPLVLEPRPRHYRPRRNALAPLGLTWRQFRWS